MSLSFWSWALAFLTLYDAGMSGTDPVTGRGRVHGDAAADCRQRDPDRHCGESLPVRP
jgi:hypothetical protein